MSQTLSSSEILFAGKGLGAVSWYRCGQPSFQLGCDWAALVGRPPDVQIVGGLKRNGLELPDFESYKIIVFQQVSGPAWLNYIRKLQNKGVICLYEIDDYLHGVKKKDGHIHGDVFTPKVLLEHEICMKVCNGMICSTEFLARRYKKFNPNVWVCRNGIEGERYKRYELPERDLTHIGWAGGVGHDKAVREVLEPINQVLDEYPEVRFYSIGTPFAKLLKRPEAYAIPTVQMENYPAVLTNLDIGIAPARNTNFYRGKSDLRFLEAGAIGIPLVAHPLVYPEIEPGETGLFAESAQELYDGLCFYLDNPEDRKRIGQNARKYVLENRTIEQGCQQWIDVFTEVLDGGNE